LILRNPLNRNWHGTFCLFQHQWQGAAQQQHQQQHNQPPRPHHQLQTSNFRPATSDQQLQTTTISWCSTSPWKPCQCHFRYLIFGFAYQLATFQMEAFSWLLWWTHMPGVDWVCYAPLLFSKKDVPLGLFETASKTSTIRCTIKKKPPSKTRKAGRKLKKILKIVPSGFSRGHWYGQQFWEALRKRKWVRTVWNYSHTDQFGWALITQMYYVPFGSLPAATPTTEGFPEKTLGEFKGMKFFKLCSTHTEVLVIHFIWAPLGPSTNPFPPCHHTTLSFLPNHAPTQPSAHTHTR
jgi:hypothetical protein